MLGRLSIRVILTSFFQKNCNAFCNAPRRSFTENTAEALFGEMDDGSNSGKVPARLIAASESQRQQVPAWDRPSLSMVAENPSDQDRQKRYDRQSERRQKGSATEVLATQNCIRKRYNCIRKRYRTTGTVYYYYGTMQRAGLVAWEAAARSGSAC